MINITDKKACCGCWACENVCPKGCIRMEEDNEGFRYPKVDTEKCIECGLCEKVCPIKQPRQDDTVPESFVVQNKNAQILRNSTSGGFYSAIANYVIEKGGVVFGAAFDENMTLRHTYSETLEGCTRFRGSKYVQSRIGDNYKKAESFLKSGRKVLFSGTPCQIAGLNLYLRKEYENLLTVDFICHGVPSPGVWREYLKEEIARQCDGKNSVLSHPMEKESVKIKHISFRDKKLGWKKYSFALILSVSDRHGVENTVLLSEPLNKNLFLRGFLADLYLRPSCYACPAKCLKSGSDVTIGDFWGIEKVMPEMDDDKGVSVVLFNNIRSCCNVEYSKLNAIVSETRYEKVVLSNSALTYSAKAYMNRKNLVPDKNLLKKIEYYTYLSTFRSIIERIRYILTKIQLI